MDGQMRLTALVLGLLFLVGTATLVVSSNLFNYTPFPTSADLSLSPDSDASATTRNQPARPRRVPSSNTVDPSVSRARLARLQSQLDDRTNQLNDRNGRIDQLNSQLRELRASATPGSRSRPVPRPSPRAESTSATSTDPDLREEIDRLNEVLLNADLQDVEYRQQIAVLRDSLDKANDELDLLEDGAAAQLNTSAVQQRRRETIIGDLVARFGSDSVPLLVDFLEQDDPRLRLWAVRVLGRLGDNAEEAIQDITPLFDDSSAEVREAARQAVDSIRGR